MIILILLNILDAYLTIKALGKGAQEANPIVRKLIEKIGVIPSLALLKVSMLAVVWYIGSQELVWFLCVAYAGLCAWNLKVLRAL
jgi:hypothetical protein